nr:hypothetical protein [uncultured Rhodopila sp.]
MPTLRDRVLFVIAGKDPEFWPRDLALAARQGSFELFEALAELATVQRPAAAPAPACTVRRIPRIRRQQWDDRPETPTGRFVRPLSLDPVVDWDLSDGATRCLQLVMSLAGGAGKAFVTLTCSIAKQLGRTTRTVQNYWNDLSAAGYLRRSFDRKSGLVTVTVTEAAAPVARVGDQPADAWPKPPAPEKAGKTGFRARLRRLVVEGAKLDARINASIDTKALSGLLPTPGRDLDRDIERAEQFFETAAADRKVLLR